MVNKLRGGLKVASVKAPGFGDRRKAMLEDMNKIKAEAVLDYERSLSSFDWTAEQYIANMLENQND